MTMRALLKTPSHVTWTDVPRSGIQAPNDVEVRVVCAGICRTDLYVARGLLAGAATVVLGHEFAGVVTAVGSGVERVAPGDHVTAAPHIGCGDCPVCRSGEPGYRCLRPHMIGVERDGAFAEYITMPAANVFRLPDDLSFKRGAYVEPVAASLAVVTALEEQPGSMRPTRGLIYGGGRIAELTRRILVAHGFENLRVFDPDGDAELAEASVDFIVETRATDEAMRAMFRALVPGGVLVLKSRPERAVAIDVMAAVRKELRLQGAHYGPFEGAIDMLATGRIEVDDLFGPTHEMTDHAAVFDALWADESLKHFLAPDQAR